MKTLINTSAWLDNIRDAEYYSQYAENCRMNGTEPGGTDSQAFTDYAVRDCRTDTEDTLDNLRNSPAAGGVWCITGSVGRWDGRHEIMPYFADGLAGAITVCSQSCEDLTAEYDTTAVYVTASHHDGRNSFTLRRLSPKGERLWREDTDALCESLEADGTFTALPEYLF